MNRAETDLLINFGARLEELIRASWVLAGRRGREPRWRLYLGRELALLLTAARRRLSEEIRRQIEPRRNPATSDPKKRRPKKPLSDGEVRKIYRLRRRK